MRTPPPAQHYQRTLTYQHPSRAGKSLYANLDSHLELELADWKKPRAYRLAALDAGQLAFTDTTLDSWPVAVVTAPADARFTTGQAQYSLREQTQGGATMRVLAFSPAGIASVTARLTCGAWSSPPVALQPANADDAAHQCVWPCLDESVPEQAVGAMPRNGLFEAPLPDGAPAACTVGLHELTIQVVDKEGRKVSRSQPFRWVVKQRECGLSYVGGTGSAC